MLFNFLLIRFIYFLGRNNRKLEQVRKQVLLAAKHVAPSFHTFTNCWRAELLRKSGGLKMDWDEMSLSMKLWNGTGRRRIGEWIQSLNGAIERNGI